MSGLPTSLRDQIVAEIMSLVRPQPRTIEPRPTIEELEKILSSENTDDVRIEPDGTVSVRPTVTTVGAVADKVLALLDGGWQPIASAPRDDETWILAIQKGAKIPFVTGWDDGWFTFNRCYEDTIASRDDRRGKEWKPDFWQPLPPPPRATAEELVEPSGFATSEELFAELGSPDPAKDARAIDAIIRRGDMHSIDNPKDPTP